jgi:ketosteroid isomerase-like protein
VRCPHADADERKSGVVPPRIRPPEKPVAARNGVAVLSGAPGGHMKGFAAVLVVAMAAFTVSTATVRNQGKTDPVLDKLAREFESAFNAKDAKKIAALYAEDAVVMPPNRPMVKGRAAIAADIQRDWSGGVTNLKLMPFDSAIIGDRGYEAGTSTVSINGKPMSGKYVVIYKRVGNDWLIAYDSFSGDQPPPPQPQK